MMSSDSRGLTIDRHAAGISKQMIRRWIVEREIDSRVESARRIGERVLSMILSCVDWCGTQF